MYHMRWSLQYVIFLSHVFGQPTDVGDDLIVSLSRKVVEQDNLKANLASIDDDQLRIIKTNQLVDMFGEIDIQYRAVCAGGHVSKGNFKAAVHFDGHHAHYTKVQNIDGFGLITLTGHGQPYLSTAEYHHTICKRIDATLWCSYYHFGTVTSEITLTGSDKGITMDMVRENEGAVKQRPFVIQTCAHMDPKHFNPGCPSPNFRNPHCVMDPISVTTSSKPSV
ncbi:protein of unknown function [Taphrina deformans PYCC 5710]|uniref:Secreted protein n=1 Tax=Taphrina deformans (strain PYCC 5710 / ATCC 11124 / CBS 356.35 / IMI 108563 / JCM 9778 / NBRC 8474) TaxID=1097556 RepID=R4XFW9_TAPDE|nr:protein of unknown function [Taphrina deformans PYCC 5710]|eukprot:CCG83389.1 protein of unknown function [Taphrina deformans PYCC 5710]